MTVTLETLPEPVYGRALPGRALPGRALRIGLAALLLAAAFSAPPVRAQGDDGGIVDARDALRRKDTMRLAVLRDAAIEANHPLAMWPAYWELGNRIADVQPDEAGAFMARWSGTYVEDRFRNDWLLELGRRRDWADFALEYPRFRMNDDREVSCYALLTDHLGGKDVADDARRAWLAQRDTDDGCALLASTLYAAKVFNAADVWRKARVAVDAGRLGAARQAAGLIGPAAAQAVAALTDNPARYLAGKASSTNREAAELSALALIRSAAGDPDYAAAQLDQRWQRRLPADLAGWAWAAVAKQAAIKLQPDAADDFQRAERYAAKAGATADWPVDTLAWKVRAALRADNGRARWQPVVQAIDAMPDDEQRDPAWVYWKARGLLALAADSQDGAAMRALAREQLAGIAAQMNFYGVLAAEQLGQPISMPERPAPLTAAEREGAAANPGLARGLQLIALGLRSEGVREWNYTLRGMDDRELLAAAQLACDREVWDRCIHTSERTHAQIDIEQRYPMPYRSELTARATEIGLDPAYVYGLIRQESRFVTSARSSVGASGLMQIMPATARWTAKKIGLPYSSELIADRDTNLRLGTAYLKLVLDDFGGSQALAAAAYNAGPNRSRRWRDGPPLEPAVWAENVPFNETRDYVKKVLANATYYAARLSDKAPSLTARLGRVIAPASDLAAVDLQLP